jgi:hypothetical protein
MEQPYEKPSRNLPMKKIIFNNFIGGIFWALGATVGLSIILTLLGFFVRNLDLVPVVGSFVSSVIEFIQVTNPNL